MELAPFPVAFYAGDRSVIAIYAGDELIWWRVSVSVDTGPSGGGTLSAAAWPSFVLAGSHPGDGTLEATTGQSYSVAVTRGGSGILSATMVPSYSPALGGGGGLSAKIGVLSFSDLFGDGALSATRIAVRASAASLSGDGALSATMVQRYAASVDFSSIGTLFGFSGVVEPLFPALNGGGALSFITSKTEGLQIGFFGSSTLNVVARMFALRTQAAVDGSGALSASAWAAYRSLPAPSGSGALSAASFIKRFSGIGPFGAGALMATLAEKYPQPGPSGGVGTMTAVISNQIYQVAAHFSGGSNFSGTGINSLYPDGLTGVMKIVAGLASAYPTGDGVLSATTKKIVPISASLVGGGVTSAALV